MWTMARNSGMGFGMVVHPQVQIMDWRQLRFQCTCIAADCRPRLSPPVACAASRHWRSRSSRETAVLRGLEGIAQGLHHRRAYHGVRAAGVVDAGATPPPRKLHRCCVGSGRPRAVDQTVLAPVAADFDQRLQATGAGNPSSSRAIPRRR